MSQESVCIVILLASAVLVGVLRFTVPGHDLTYAGSYEAFAHIWTGAVLVVAVVYWHEWLGKLSALSLFILSAFETAMFFIQKHKRSGV